MATESSRSPLRKADGSLPPSPLNSIPDHSTSPPSSAVFGRNDLSVVMAMAEREPEPAGSRVVSGILHRDRREEAVRRTAVVARLAAAALCLVAFSVLAADRDKGWALDSYNRYKQFRYGSAQDFSFDCHSRIGSLSVVERARHIGASKVPNNDI
nr:PREDICTED: CASP-like protein 4A1 [Musa acuminata subsp. malaccensis]